MAKLKLSKVEQKILDCLKYDPKTGDITWTKSQAGGSVKAGALAGGIDKDGYRCIRVATVLMRAHRIAWFVQTGAWPEGEIDHRNGDRSDNRWDNLRTATREGNTQNTRSYSRSGFKGVYPQNSQTSPWQAQIQVGSEVRCLGSFPTPEEAAQAYDSAAIEHFGEFSHLNFPSEAPYATP